MQRELAHHQYFAADLPHVEIHHPAFVVENPQPGEFTRKPLDILLAVLGFDTDETNRPGPMADLRVPPMETDARRTR